MLGRVLYRGEMDYFKHYSTASSSKSLNLIFDEFGHKGIAFWWMLLELCAENWDGHSEPEFEFHQRVVASKLRSSVNSVGTWLAQCDHLGMCAFAKKETVFQIKLPKLSEVKTSRNTVKSNKLQLLQNRIEENRIESIAHAKTISHGRIKTLDELINAWNKNAIKFKLPFSPLSFSRQTTDSFFEISAMIGKNKSSWEDYLSRFIESDFLLEKMKKKPSITWLLSPVNYDKIMAGAFDNQPEEESQEALAQKLFAKAFADQVNQEAKGEL